MKAGFFADHYENGKEFCWEGPYSQECFSDFLKLLENSRYSKEKRNPNLISLLEDWDCPDIIEDLISQVKSEFDHTIIHNGHQYQVNLRTFSTLSQFFCSQITSSPEEMISVSDEYSEETFSLFLDCVHGNKSLPQDEKLVEIYILSHNWECNSLLGLINTKSTSYILPALSKGDLIDQKMVEENATQQILSLIQDPRFYQLPLSTLSRVVSKSRIHDIFDNLLLFIVNLLEAHGIEAFLLIFSLDFRNCSEENVLLLLEKMSIHSHSSLFPMLKKQFLFFVENGNELKKDKAENQKRIEELNQKMKRKEAEDQQRIEELNQQVEKLKNKFIEEDQRRREEYEGVVNGKWKSTKAPDFESNIFEAAAKGKLTSIMYLLANGTNVNEEYQEDEEYDGLDMKNSTPLHFSSRYGHLSVVEYLVNQKADINSKNNGVEFL